MRSHLTWFVLLLLLLPAAAAGGEWYLMLPPVEKGKSVFDRPKVDRNAPMTQWLQKDSFDSAEECRTARDIQFGVYNNMADKAWEDTPYMGTGDKDYRHMSGQLYLGYIAEAYRYGNALCVASNDPRLAPTR